MSSGRKGAGSGVGNKVVDSSELAESIKEKVDQARYNKSARPSTAPASRLKVSWESLKRPLSFDELSRWVSDDDFEWAKSVGIYVYPKGFTREEGVTVLAPQLLRALRANLPEVDDQSAQDIAMGVLNSINSFNPNLESKDMLRAFALISSEIGLQYFPHLLKLPSPRTE
jgi:hypothetical protein